MRHRVFVFAGTVAMFCGLVSTPCLAEFASGFSLRPYLRLGTLFTAPSAEDLGFPDTSKPELAKTHFGVGFQGTKAFGGQRPKSRIIEPAMMRPGLSKSKLNVGVDIGFFRLFASDANVDYLFSESVPMSITQSEWCLNTNFFLEYSPTGGILFMQGGMGLSWVFSSEPDLVADYPDGYGYIDADDDPVPGEMQVHLGLMAAVGVDLPIDDNLGLTITARIDPVFRHGVMIPAAISMGCVIGI